MFISMIFPALDWVFHRVNDAHFHDAGILFGIAKSIAAPVQRAVGLSWRRLYVGVSVPVFCVSVAPIDTTAPCAFRVPADPLVTFVRENVNPT